MVDCEFCGIVHGDFDSDEIYQDDKVIAVLHLKPASPGHVLIFTKKHYPIIEQVPDYIIGHVFTVANKLSTILFETLGVQGTNLLIENGVAANQQIAHFSLHIVPRKENDGLPLEWQAGEFSEEQKDIAFHQIKEKAESIHPTEFEKEGQVQTKTAVPKKQTKKKAKSDKGNYRLRQLRRIP